MSKEIFLEKVKKLIEDNKGKEITNTTEKKYPGIYMIYIDNFEDENVIPIYIGQTKDLQKRYKEHYKEILALNRFDYFVYAGSMFNGMYEGRYKSCKIFKYMIDHKCTLKDYHVIELEKVEDVDLLEEKEQEYFREYLPSFFGFNQFNTRIELNKYSGVRPADIPKRKLYNIIMEDALNIEKYYNYGFTEFNYKNCFIGKNAEKVKNIFNSTNKMKDIKEVLSRINKNYAGVKEKDFTSEIKPLEAETTKLKTKLNKIISTEIEPKLKKFFDDNKLKSRDKLRDAKKYIYYKDEALRKGVNRYLQNRNITEDIIEKIITDTKDIASITYEKWNELQLKLDELKFQSKEYLFRNLLPLKRYENSHVLKDNYKEYNFSKEDLENYCVININFTNNGRGSTGLIFKRTEPIKIDYYIKTSEKEIERKNLFIFSYFDEFFNNENMYYYEKDIRKMFVKLQEPFNIKLSTDDGYFINCLSLETEYNTGINEYTLQNNKKYGFFNILTEIQEQINADTKIIFNTSEAKKCLLQYSAELEDLKLPISDELLKIARKK